MRKKDPELLIATVNLEGEEVQLHEQAANFRGTPRSSDQYRLQYRPLEDALYASLEERFGLTTSPSVKDTEAFSTFLQDKFNTSPAAVLQRWFKNRKVCVSKGSRQPWHLIWQVYTHVARSKSAESLARHAPLVQDTHVERCSRRQHTYMYMYMSLHVMTLAFCPCICLACRRKEALVALLPTPMAQTQLPPPMLMLTLMLRMADHLEVGVWAPAPWVPAPLHLLHPT